MSTIAIERPGPIDPPTWEVDLRLTRMENRVLWALRKRAGHLVTYATLIRETWGEEWEEDLQECLKVYAHRIRTKAGQPVRTKVHYGYYLAVEGQAVRSPLFLSSAVIDERNGSGPDSDGTVAETDQANRQVPRAEDRGPSAASIEEPPQVPAGGAGTSSASAPGPNPASNSVPPALSPEAVALPLNGVCAGPGRWMCTIGAGHLCGEDGDA